MPSRWHRRSTTRPASALPRFPGVGPARIRQLKLQQTVPTRPQARASVAARDDIDRVATQRHGRTTGSPGKQQHSQQRGLQRQRIRSNPQTLADGNGDRRGGNGQQLAQAAGGGDRSQDVGATPTGRRRVRAGQQLAKVGGQTRRRAMRKARCSRKVLVLQFRRRQRFEAAEDNGQSIVAGVRKRPRQRADRSCVMRMPQRLERQRQVGRR